MRKWHLAAATAAAVVMIVGVAVAPANAAERPSWNSAPHGSIVDVAVAASGGGTPDNNPNDYDILVQALIATGLDKVLADTSKTYTVFAPNDRAFERLVTDLTGKAPTSEAAALTTITSTFTAAQISNILLYHVVAGKRLGAVQVVFSRSITMANGGRIYPRLITLRDETPSLPDPRLVLTAVNIPASNGVIHTIDRVLVPAGA
jgi:uncharacterized surface protein with fasciclin (FAS1) repeats